MGLDRHMRHDIKNASASSDGHETGIDTDIHRPRSSTGCSYGWDAILRRIGGTFRKGGHPIGVGDSHGHLDRRIGGTFRKGGQPIGATATVT